MKTENRTITLSFKGTPSQKIEYTNLANNQNISLSEYLSSIVEINKTHYETIEQIKKAEEAQAELNDDYELLYNSNEELEHKNNELINENNMLIKTIEDNTIQKLKLKKMIQYLEKIIEHTNNLIDKEISEVNEYQLISYLPKETFLKLKIDLTKLEILSE